MGKKNSITDYELVIRNKIRVGPKGKENRLRIRAPK
jgi:hypothetical protein